MARRVALAPRSSLAPFLFSMGCPSTTVKALLSCSRTCTRTYHRSTCRCTGSGSAWCLSFLRVPTLSSLLAPVALAHAPRPPPRPRMRAFLPPLLRGISGTMFYFLNPLLFIKIWAKITFDSDFDPETTDSQRSIQIFSFSGTQKNRISHKNILRTFIMNK